MRQLLGHLWLAAALLPLVFAVTVGCTSGESAEPEATSTNGSSTNTSAATTTVLATSTSTSSSSLVDCSTPRADIGPRPDLDSLVSIALYCETDDELRLIDRVVPAGSDPLEAVVEQLLLGVTPAEAQAGLRSAFSTYTAGQFNSVVTGADGVAVIDLTPAFIRTNNFSTSHMSMEVFTQIRESLFAVPDISGIELSVDGVRWCGWEAGHCDQYARPLIERSK